MLRSVYWALADFGGVMGKKDLFRILVDPEPLDPIDPRRGVVDYQKANELLALIENSETRQERAQC